MFTHENLLSRVTTFPPMASKALAVALVFGAVYARFRLKTRLLPPGPPGLFIFGNAFEIRNAKFLWLKLADLAKLYGPIFTLRLPQTPVIVVSDAEMVIELFEKRSNNFSNRPIFQMIQLAGWGDRIVFTQYNQTLRSYRKLLHRAFNAHVTPEYQEIQMHSVRQLMKRLVETPDDFLKHIHLMAASTSVRITYGHVAQGYDDPFIRSAEEVMAALTEATVPGRWIVDTVPLLRHIPSWFPGAAFKRKTEQWARMRISHRTRPFQYVLDNIAKGTAEVSFVSLLLEPEHGVEITTEEKEMIKCLASSLYDAGVDTTVSLIQSFFLAMTLYPAVQKQAHSEIDNYLTLLNLEEARMLTISDRDKLPYTSALVSEVLRWHPATNIAAHNSGEKEEFMFGYRIPAGTMVLANLWAILHNSDVYTNPQSFNPDRFLQEIPAPDPALYAFGFGRRACPGIHIAQQSQWVTISNILANFSITKALDKDGAEIVPKENYTSTIFSRPIPFKCSITARSESSLKFACDISG